MLLFADHDDPMSGLDFFRVGGDLWQETFVARRDIEVTFKEKRGHPGLEITHGPQEEGNTQCRGTPRMMAKLKDQTARALTQSTLRLR